MFVVFGDSFAVMVAIVWQKAPAVNGNRMLRVNRLVKAAGVRLGEKVGIVQSGGGLAKSTWKLRECDR